METQAPYPDPMLTDNNKTAAFMLKDVKDEAARATIIQWGKDREPRLERLSWLVGLLEEHGVINKEMETYLHDFVIQHCVAIAARYGFDLGYAYRDSESGPLASFLEIDLHAVKPAYSKTKPDPFDSNGTRAAFLAEIIGRSPEKLGKMARNTVLEELHRIYD